MLLGGLFRRPLPLSMAEPAPRVTRPSPSGSPSGTLVAHLLAGSWRADPPPLPSSEPDALAEILPFLLASGSGALAWSRIRSDPRLAATPAGLALHDAYRHAVIDAAVRERRIVDVVRRLRADGIEPMLFKGRAAATAYATPACRPGGDIDLLLRPEDEGQAEAVLEEEVRLLVVDLNHGHLVREQERAGLFARAGHLEFGGVAVTVPSPEDHLRLLALHALAHGVARPFWLSDVAAWVEARQEGFDWSAAQSADPRTAERVRVALGLAHQLLGMRPEGTPVEHGASPPRWAGSALLRRWADPRNATPMRPWSHGPLRSLPLALAQRWPPDPVLEAVRNGRRFSRWPRLPFSVADAARRAFRHDRSPAGTPRRP